MEPNFFIIGAPKCGTTALYSYLTTHPSVFLSEPKEPNYFCNDFPRIREFQNLEDYLRIFGVASKKHKVIGEASTWYLHSKVAISNILERYPSAKMVALVRNPVDMVYSLHSQLVYNGAEEVRDFEKAWYLQSERRNRPFVQYAQIGRLGSALQRAMNTVPPGQLRVVVFDDLRTAPRNVYLDVLQYLELHDDGRSEFHVVNESKRVRSDLLRNFAKNTPQSITAVTRYLKRGLGLESLGIMDQILKWNTKSSSRPALSDRMREILSREFEEDVAVLSTLLKRDLGHWLQN